jgi:hypothetical protein
VKVQNPGSKIIILLHRKLKFSDKLPKLGKWLSMDKGSTIAGHQAFHKAWARSTKVDPVTKIPSQLALQCGGTHPK